MSEPENSFDFSPLEQAAVQLHEIYLSLMRAGFSSDEALDLIVKSSNFKSKKPSSEKVSPEFNIVYEDPSAQSLLTQVEHARYYGYTDVKGTFDREILFRYRYPYGFDENGYPKEFKRSYYDKRETIVEEIWKSKTNQWEPTTRLTEHLRKGESTLSAIPFFHAKTIFPGAFKE